MLAIPTAPFPSGFTWPVLHLNFSQFGALISSLFILSPISMTYLHSICLSSFAHTMRAISNFYSEVHKRVLFGKFKRECLDLWSADQTLLARYILAHSPDLPYEERIVLGKQTNLCRTKCKIKCSWYMYLKCEPPSKKVVVSVTNSTLFN